MGKAPPFDMTARLVLEVFPSVMGRVSCLLRREAPVDKQPHFLVLRMLRDRTLTIHELADAVSVRLPTMSRTIDTLCGKGWTERYHEPEDRRTVHVRIKEEGLLALEKTEDLARRTVLTILEGMSSEALGELYSGLDELNRSLDPSKDIAKGTICEET